MKITLFNYSNGYCQSMLTSLRLPLIAVLTLFFLCGSDLGAFAQTAVVNKVSGNELVGETCLYKVEDNGGTATVTNSGWSVSPSSAATSVTKIAADIVEVVWRNPGNATLTVQAQFNDQATIYPFGLNCVIGVNKTILKERIDYARFNYPMGNDARASSNELFYTTNSWDAYISEYAAAKSVYDNSSSTQAQVNSVAASLNDAMNNLVLSSTLVKRNISLFDMTVIPPQNNLICAGSTVQLRVNIDTKAPLKSQDKGVGNRNVRRNELYIVLPDNYTDYFTAAMTDLPSSWVKFSVVKENSGSPVPGVYRYANYDSDIEMTLRNGLGTINTPIEIPYKIVWRTKLIDEIKTGCGAIADNDYDMCTTCGATAECPDKGDWATVGYYEGVLVIPVTVPPTQPVIESKLPGGNLLCSSEPAILTSTANHPAGSYYIWKKDGTTVSEGVDFTTLAVAPNSISGSANYTLTVQDYGNCSSLTSSPITLTEAVMPTITTQDITGIFPGQSVDIRTGVVLTSNCNNCDIKYYTDVDCLFEVGTPAAVTGLNSDTRFWVKAISDNDCEVISSFEVKIANWNFDLAVTANTDPVCLGKDVTFSIVIGNTQAVAAPNVVIPITFGSGLTLKNYTASIGYSESDRKWTIPSLAANSTQTLELTFTATPAGVDSVKATVDSVNSVELIPLISSKDVITINPDFTCAISGNTGIACAHEVRNFTGIDAPATDTYTYNWSIVGEGIIVGADNLQAVDVKSNKVCDTSYTLSLTITDQHGCVVTCTQDIVIKDTEVPTFMAPNDTTLYRNDLCAVDTTPASTGVPTSIADNCTGTPIVTYSDVIKPGACASNDTIFRTWTVTDSCGNTAPAKTQKITVLDTIKPTFTAPADITVYKDANCLADTSVAITGTVTNAADNCTSAPIITHSDAILAGSCAGNYFIDRTWTVTDSCGNIAPTQTQRITVLDTISPTFTVPNDTTLYRDDLCIVDTTPASTGVPTNIADNCMGTPIVTYSNVIKPGACASNDTIFRTWTVTDSCGNMLSKVQKITVLDTVKPTFTAPADITVYKDANCLADTSVAITGTVTNAADNCTSVPIITHSDAILAGSCAGNYFIDRTWTVTDSCGNIAPTQTQRITVLDTISPTFIVPVDFVIYKDALCAASTDPAITGTPTNLSDNCTPSTNITYSHLDVAGIGTCIVENIITRTWTVTDACGNETKKDQIITMRDTTKPTFTAPADITVYVDASRQFDTTTSKTGTVTTASDNCTQSNLLIANYSDNAVSTGCGYNMTITRTWTVTDLCNNSAPAQNQIIIVLDTLKPSLTLASDTIRGDINTVEVISLTNIEASADIWVHYAFNHKDSTTVLYDSLFIAKTDFPIYDWAYQLPGETGTFYLTLTRIADINSCETLIRDTVVIIATSCLNVDFTMACPKDTVATLDYGSCKYHFTSIGKPVITINGADQSLDSTIKVTHDGPANLIFDRGQYHIKWVAENDCGVKDSCYQWVVVNYPPCNPVDTIWYINTLGQLTYKIDSLYAIDFEMKRYPTTRINCDCWTAENLTSTKDRIGNPIASSIYQARGHKDTVANLAKYGRLYDGITASLGGVQDADGDIPGICPDGWVLPTVAQYDGLIAYSGDDLRKANEWLHDNTSNNSTKFSALPGGYYNETTNSFILLLGDAYFWTSDCYNGIGKTAHIRYSCPILLIENFNILNKASVRCVKK